MSGPEAYYLPDGPGRWVPTIATESPWDTDAQHGGPPTALAVHAMEDLGAGDGPGMRTARVAMEFLGTLPRRPLTVEAAVARRGRRIRMLEATVTAGDRFVAVARAWQIATSDGTPVPSPVPAPGRLPPAQEQRYFRGLETWGYGESIEWRFAVSGYDEPGPADVWGRVRLPLVAGEPIRPIERVLVLADSANGVSGVLPSDAWLFVPPGITVTLHRPPTGEWVRMEAETTLAPDGLGSTLAILGDEQGPIGTATQALLVAPRQ